MFAGRPLGDMSVTIFYRHSRRRDEAGMTRVHNDGYAAALKNQLEKRGFLIVEIVSAPDSKNVAVGGDDD